MSDPFGPLEGRATSADAGVGWVEDPWDVVEAVLHDDLVSVGTDKPRRSRRVRLAVSVAIAVMVSAIVVVGGVGWWYLRQVNPPGEAMAAVNFTVVEGDDLAAVSRRLEEANFITSARVFRWYVERKGGIDFVPGYYQIKPRDHMGNIMGSLNTPPAQTFENVTFPEGFTLAQIATRLAEKVPRLDAATLLDRAASGEIVSSYAPTGTTSLEGLLFPDTYQVSGDDSATRVLQRMASLMERVGRQEGLDRAQDTVGDSPY